MAETIKGIQVKIEGNTKSLSNALKDIDKNIKGTEKNLRTVDKLLKLDPSNVSLTAEKEQLLAKNVDEVAKKLETLKKVQGQISQQYKNGTIGTDAYLDFQKTLVETEQKYNKLTNAIEGNTKSLEENTNTSTATMKDYYEQVDNTSKSAEKSSNKHEILSNTLKSLEKGVKSVTSALGKMAINTAKVGFEAINTTVQKSVGLFEDYTKLLTGVASAVTAFSTGVGTSFTAQMSTVQSLLGYTDYSQEQLEIMDRLEEKAKQVGATTKFTATEAGKALEYMAMAGWNDAEMLDGMDGIVNLTIASGEELATTSDIVTDALTAFGLSAKDSSRFADVLSATVTNSNTNVSMLGEAFKYVGPMANALGYSIEDVSLALGLMANAGVKGEQAGNALKTSLARLASPTKQAQEVIDRLGISLTDEDGNTLGFADMLEQLRDKLKGVSAELVNADGSLKEYEEIEEELQGKNEQLQLISDASNLFGKNQVASMLALVNASDKDFQALKESIDTCKGSAEEMAEVRIDNLTGDVTILTSAMEGVGLSIFEYIESPLRELTTTTTSLMDNLNKNIGDGLNFSAMNVNIREFANKIGNQFKSAMPSINSTIEQSSKLLNAIIESTLENALDLVPNAIGYGLPNIIDSYWSLVDNIISQISQSAPTLIENGGKVINSFVTGLTDASNNIREVLPNVINSLSTGITNIFPNVLSMGKSILGTIVTGMTEALPEILNVGTEIFSFMSNALQNAPEQLATLLDNVLRTGLASDLPVFISSLSGIIDSVIEVFSNSDVISNFQTIVKVVGNSIINGLTEIVPEVVAFLPTFLDGFIQPMLNLLTDSDLLMTISTTFADLLTITIDFLAQNTEPFVSSLVQIITSLADALTENVDVILPAISTMITGVLVGVANNIDSLLTSLLDLIGAIAITLTSPEVITPLLDGAVTLISKTLFAIIDNLAPLTEAITNIFLAMVQVMADPQNLTAICEAVFELITAVISAIPTLILGLGDALISSYKAFKTLLEEQDWSNIGSNILQGIINGMVDALDYAYETVTNIGNHIVSWFKDVFDINSPSKVLEDSVGKFLLPGVSEGIADTMPEFENDISNVSDTVVKSMKFGNIEGTMTTNLSSVLIPTIPALPDTDGYGGYSNTISNINNNTNNSYSNSYGSIFSGANIYINNDNDIETLAQKLQFYMQQNEMGVGVG